MFFNFGRKNPENLSFQNIYFLATCDKFLAHFLIFQNLEYTLVSFLSRQSLVLELAGFRLFVEVLALVLVFGIVLALVLAVLVDFGVFDSGLVESEVVLLIGVVACVVVEEGIFTRNTVIITYIRVKHVAFTVKL